MHKNQQASIDYCSDAKDCNTQAALVPNYIKYQPVKGKIKKINKNSIKKMNI